MTFVWKCFQDINFHWVVFRLYEQSKESVVRLVWFRFGTMFIPSNFSTFTKSPSDLCDPSACHACGEYKTARVTEKYTYMT